MFSIFCRNRLTRIGVSPRVAITDYMSSILNIITPSKSTLVLTETEVMSFLLVYCYSAVRPVNTALLNPAEKEQMNDLIDTLIGLSMTFKPKSHVFGLATQAIHYQVEPCIEALCNFTYPLQDKTVKEMDVTDIKLLMIKPHIHNNRRVLHNTVKQIISKEVQKLGQSVLPPR